MPPLTINTDLVAKMIRELLDVCEAFSEKKPAKAHNKASQALGLAEAVLRFTKEDRDADRFLSLAREAEDWLGKLPTQTTPPVVVSVSPSNPRTNGRLTEMQRKQIVDDFNKTDLSLPQFCRHEAKQYGVDPATIRYHVNRATQ